MTAKQNRIAARRARRMDNQTSASALVPTKSSSSASGEYKWQYEEGSSLFKNYDPKASDIVEEHYQEYLATPSNWDVRSVHSGEWRYQVDFPNMIQTNIQHENHRVRAIRRVPC